MDARRILKVSEAVKEELSEIVGFEMEDPRLADVDVTDVLVSSDWRHASVRVALRGDARQAKKALEALEHAAGFLRHELASRLQLRQIPELHFTQDKNPDIDTRLDILLKRARRNRGKEAL